MPASPSGSSATSTRASRNQRRVLAGNRDLVGETIAGKASSEQYSLFRAYVTARHGEGGMAEMSALDFAMMIDDSHVETRVTEYRRRGPDSGITGRGAGPLVAFVVTDRLRDGFSLVYSAFDPALVGAQPRDLPHPRSHHAIDARQGFPISISATGSMARARWTTSAASSPWSGSVRTAGSATRRIDG